MEGPPLLRAARITLALTGTAALMLGLAGPGLAQPSDAAAQPVGWPQFQGSAQHRGSVAGWPAAGLTQAWTAPTDGGASAPIIAWDLVLFTTRTQLVALDLADGSVRWTADRIPGPIVSPAAVEVDGTRQVLTTQGVNEASSLVAYDVDQDGELLSAGNGSGEPGQEGDGGDRALDDEARDDSPMDDAPDASVMSQGDELLRLDATSHSGVSVDGSIAMVADDMGGVYAVDLTTNEKLWKRPTGGPPIVAPIGMSDGIAYMLDNKDPAKTLFVGVDTSDGSTVFQTALGPAGVSTSVSVDDGKAFAAFTDSTVRAFDAQDGRMLWSRRVIRASTIGALLAIGQMSSPAVAGGTVVVTGPSGGVYALDTVTGHPLWDFQIQGGYITRSSPVIAGSTVYVGLLDGSVVALRLRDGHQVFATPTGPGSVKPMALSPELLVIGHGDRGGIRAFRPDADRSLTDIRSATELRFRSMLPPFLGALLVVGGLALVIGVVVRRVEAGRTPPPDPWEADDLEEDA